MGNKRKSLSTGGRIGLWILVILLFFLPFTRNVKSQSSGLSVAPPASNLYLNGSNTVSISLYVTGADQLQAFDLSVSYDPTLVHFDSWSHGGLLGYSLFPLVQDIQEGYLHLAFTKMGPPGASGSGNLLILNFSGVGYGVSPVTIETAVFSSSSGVLTYPVLTDGTINCTYASSPIIYSSLSGEISLQGTSKRGGIPVTLQRGLFVGQGPYTSLSLAQPNINLFFSSLAMDAYRVTTAQSRFLNLEAADGKLVGVLSGPTQMNPLVLFSGNAAWQDNNEINLQDLDAIRDAFDRNGLSLDADVNFDGVVDIRDLALAGGNFGLNSSTAYMQWLP